MYIYIYVHNMKHDAETNIGMLEVSNVKIKKPKKNRKEKEIVKEREFEIPKYSDYLNFNKKKYNVTMLKDICREYKLKLAGNKSELTNRIYKYLFESNYAVIIQKNIKKFVVKKYFSEMGPGLFNRNLCSNSTDFFTLENIKDIEYNQFFSYKGKDNIIWGFNILSFYQLFLKTKNEVLNPYTREKISMRNFKRVKNIIRLSKMLNVSTNVILNNNVENMSTQKRLELKCLDLFQHMDELGNYTQIQWFTSLKRDQLIKFIHELHGIWQYRAQLQHEVKKMICYPYANPFRYIDIKTLALLGLYTLQKQVLSVIEQFIKKGVDRESCNLGTSYVLCGLTLVNNDAALALPWLYQSVSYSGSPS